MTSRRPLHSPSEVSASRSPIPIYSKVDKTSRLLNAEDENSSSSDEENEFVESGDGSASTDETNTDTQADVVRLDSGSTPEKTHNRPVAPIPQRSEAKEKPRQQLAKSENVQKSGLNIKLIAYAILIILPLIACTRLLKQEPQMKRCEFEKLRQREPLQSSDVWKTLTINIELLLNKKTKSPNVYLLLHSNKSSEHRIQGLVQDIALETSKCFDGQRPIEMGLQDFETKHGDDYGYPIEQYKKKIKEGNVFLIVNLNDIPPKAARALHTICDTYSPIAPDVVIFLTLRTHHEIAGATPTQLAYQMLHELWQQIPDNELDPLITRVIDQVVLLQG
ncbi:uncharacterized protein LOC6558417 [Drosophila grimshawi]|uniref:GH16916 n=1 Tax=Drosophila grimshawi TaxID=7222 RepID=B4IXQ7_DROGR|nr:uncharacterized protein LOC6558417 [Drosophila grimshawi]EDV97519.1 GH16916 [Drosophila grimshawi]